MTVAVTLSPPDSDPHILLTSGGVGTEAGPEHICLLVENHMAASWWAVRHRPHEGVGQAASSASLFVLPQDKVVCCEVRLLGCAGEVRCLRAVDISPGGALHSPHQFHLCACAQAVVLLQNEDCKPFKSKFVP